MTNRQTTAKATTKDGELTVQQHETDSPVIPVAALERLHSFKPAAVDWVISQAQVEARFGGFFISSVNKLFALYIPN